MEISSAESLLSQVRDYQAKIASARRDTGDIGAISGNGLPGTQIIDQASGTFSSRLNSAMVSSLNEVNALQQTSKKFSRSISNG